MGECSFDSFVDNVLQLVAVTDTRVLFEQYIRSDSRQKFTRAQQGNLTRPLDLQTSQRVSGPKRCSSGIMSPKQFENAVKQLAKHFRVQLTPERQTKPKQTNDKSKSLAQSKATTPEVENTKLPGTWVECCLCKKWRYLSDVHDPSLVDIGWHCALDSRKSNQVLDETPGYSRSTNPCNIPQSPIPEEIYNDCIYTSFAVGSVVWAKLQGYPEWPAMICYNQAGKYAEFDPITRIATHYFVVFLDPTHSTISRIRAGRLRRYCSGSVLQMKNIKRKFRESLEAAAHEADNALLLPIEDRIEIYGYNFEKRKFRNQGIQNVKKDGGRCTKNYAEMPSRLQGEKTMWAKYTATVPDGLKKKPRGRPRKQRDEPALLKSVGSFAKKLHPGTEVAAHRSESTESLRVKNQAFITNDTSHDNGSVSSSPCLSPSLLQRADDQYLALFRPQGDEHTTAAAKACEVPMDASLVSHRYSHISRQEQQPTLYMRQAMLDLQEYSLSFSDETTQEVAEPLNKGHFYLIHKIPFHLQLIRT
ncbi:zinc finger CW-type PWWP domain protein 1 [Clonorchis sinensis]|uniref:Zinc finger CW-type PWWP domain protein 1 n=1 Tax=Clonorchis sinensis TaxID=79923 RepID=G7Y984_CLOSI|nr:zinc finger CW-type PWWP domain protein 1 [Clonorchis sinensis]